MTHPDWHFPRTAFADEVYGLLVKTPARSATLFGPRRTGKTEFLLNDLAVYAQKRGHRVVYASLWQTPDTPIATLLHALDRAIRRRNFSAQLAEIAKGAGPRGKIGVPGVAEMSLELRETKSAVESDFITLDRLCGQLANEKKPAFLLFDEFQESARVPGGAALIAALRTSLDARSAGLVSVFTGSSQSGLHAVFSSRDAPFFRFATPISLPRLEQDFVDHQLSVAAQISSRPIARASAIRIFGLVDANPMVFQRWVQTMITRTTLGADPALREALDGLGGQAGFTSHWIKLSLRQRATARVLAEGAGEIYGAAAGVRIASLAGCAPPSHSQVLADLRRLQRAGLAENQNRSWTLCDPLFAIWARNHEVAAN